ncbi:hypothetical protein [Bifidobacterium amazonense]
MNGSGNLSFEYLKDYAMADGTLRCSTLMRMPKTTRLCCPAVK